MRILIYSRAFLPHVGGLELNVAHIAEQFTQHGHEVVVITVTPGHPDPRLEFRVVRNPGIFEFLRWMRWCEVFHQPNVSLRGYWPLLLCRRPWVVTHHSWYRRPDGRIAWQDRIKRFLLRRADGSIAVSRAIAADLETPCAVIGNAYRDELFRLLPDADRNLELVCVGRLVSDKGVDILLDALHILDGRGLHPRLTVVGEGPDRSILEAQTHRLGIAPRVRFVGTKVGEELVRILNRHRILVVPSRYEEPFGIVALEGIACGCVVVGSEGGGLRDAIGRCGRVFPNGNAAALADLLRALLHDRAAMDACLREAAAHLAPYRGARVIERYIEAFESARLRGAGK